MHWELARIQGARERLHEVCSVCLAGFHALTIWLKPVLPALATRAEAFLQTGSLTWSSLSSPPVRIGRYEHLMTRVEAQALDQLFDAPEASASGPADTQAAKPATPAAAPISIDDFNRVDLRVARVLEAHAVEGSTKLIRLSLDVGEAKPRTVFSGIRAAYDPQALVGRMMILVANLAPRKMKFGVSEGMVLSASDDDASQPSGIYLLEVDQGAHAGMRVR